MRYADGFVLPVPKKNLLAYRRMAEKGRVISGATMARSNTESAPATISRSRSEFRSLAWPRQSLERR